MDSRVGDDPPTTRLRRPPVALSRCISAGLGERASSGRKHGELRYETGADPPAGEPPDDRLTRAAAPLTDHSDAQARHLGVSMPAAASHRTETPILTRLRLSAPARAGRPRAVAA
jgi:hypothetical protein